VQKKEKKMNRNQTFSKQIFALIFTFLFTVSVFAGTVSTDSSPSLTGQWIGSFQTPGPTGLLEITLTNNENKWSGEVKIQGPGGKIFTKPAQKLEVGGETLTFMIEMVGAEITFKGKLKEGKLIGELEAVDNGKIVGMGSWEMSPAKK
jgi:hypothetical protein